MWLSCEQRMIDWTILGVEDQGTPWYDITSILLHHDLSSSPHTHHLSTSSPNGIDVLLPAT